ncbi:MAG: diguanylate cyclase [Treponemataceae bacterium]|nr:diguanylate cyclase [Treponemataceae bacterium]
MDTTQPAVETHKWNRILALSIIPIMLGLALVIAVINGFSIVRLAKKNLQVESRLQAQLVDSWITETKAKLSVYRNYLESRCITDEDILNFISVSNLAHDDFPVGVYVGTSENNMLEPNYYHPGDNFVVADRPWFSAALQENEFVMSEPYVDAMLGKPCVTLSARLKNPSLAPRTDIVRVMAADLYLDYVTRLAKNMVSSSAISGGLFVSKETGVIVANSTGLRVGSPLYRQNIEDHLIELASYADGNCIMDTLNRQTFYVNVISLKESPWYLITYVDVKQVLHELYAMILSVLAISAVTVGLLFILINYLSRKMNLVQRQAMQLSDRLEVQSTFVELIKLLTENGDFDESIAKCLQIIGDFYRADRSYIFTIDYEKKTQSNVYEWCKEGVSPQKDNLQSISTSVNQRWWPLFERNGVVQISNIDEELTPGSFEYDMLSFQKIKSLIVYPFVHEGVITGYLGVDNPHRNGRETFLLESAATCVSESLMKKQYTDVLYDRSYKDILTGAKNRRAYFEDLSKLSTQTELRIGVVFADLNGLKDTNDNQGHEAGDKLIIEVKKFLDHSFDCYYHTVYRLGGDEFVVFVYDIEERAFQKIIGKTLEILADMPIVSIGDSWIGSGDMVERQVAEADRLMYMRKKDYYREKGHDRRGNSRDRRASSEDDDL